MKMPEMLVFARVFAIGLLTTEVFRLTYYSGEKFALLLGDVDWRVRGSGIASGLVVCLAYAIIRVRIRQLFVLGEAFFSTCSWPYYSASCILGVSWSF
jgi:hypothetical protein